MALLTAEGYGVTAASSAPEAVELATSTDVHLIITDLKMSGRDGFWLLDQIGRTIRRSRW